MASFVVKSEDDFAVAHGLVGVGHLTSKFMVVVDLTVHDKDAGTDAMKRLLAAVDVNDGQPCMRETDRVLQQGGLFVGSAMAKDSIHAVENGFVGLSQDTRNPTHGSPSRLHLLKECSFSCEKNHQSG